jgi:hypothetical protein
MSIDHRTLNLSAASDEMLAGAWRDAMLHGAFENAWRVSDEVLRRRRTAPRAAKLPPRHLQAIWSGDDLTNRHVLVRCYHGLGDSVQFLRFLPALRERAARVTLWIQPALIPLLAHARCVGDACVLQLHDGDPGVAFDCDIELMELPHALRVPPRAASAVPYIHVPDAARYTDGALHVDATSESVLETARTMAALDLVITVDSFPAHLAGALGVPVWVLLPADADWRWGLTECTEWYPSAALFHQSEIDNWYSAIEAVTARLRTVRSPLTALA